MQSHIQAKNEKLIGALMYAIAVLQTKREVASAMHAPIIQEYIDALELVLAEAKVSA
jgi:hypothetical protein